MSRSIACFDERAYHTGLQEALVGEVVKAFVGCSDWESFAFERVRPDAKGIGELRRNFVGCVLVLDLVGAQLCIVVVAHAKDLILAGRIDQVGVLFVERRCLDDFKGTTLMMECSRFAPTVARIDSELSRDRLSIKP